MVGLTVYGRLQYSPYPFRHFSALYNLLLISPDPKPPTVPEPWPRPPHSPTEGLRADFRNKKRRTWWSERDPNWADEALRPQQRSGPTGSYFEVAGVHSADYIPVPAAEFLPSANDSNSQTEMSTKLEPEPPSDPPFSMDPPPLQYIDNSHHQEPDSKAKKNRPKNCLKNQLKNHLRFPVLVKLKH